METIVQIDARGLHCPLPVIRLSQAAAGLEAGSLLEVLADDPAFPVDVRAWCHMTGHDLVSLEADDAGPYRARIRVGASAVARR